MEKESKIKMDKKSGKERVKIQKCKIKIGK